MSLLVIWSLEISGQVFNLHVWATSSKLSLNFRVDAEIKQRLEVGITSTQPQKDTKTVLA